MQLLVQPPTGSERAITLGEAAQWILGRGEDCAIAIADPRLSRQHLRLEWNGSLLTFHDLGSSNGMTILDRRVESGTLEPDVVLVAGNTRIRLIASARAARWDLESFHRTLLEKLDLRDLTESRLRSAAYREEVHGIASGIARLQQPAASAAEVEGFVQTVLDEVFGLGPLERWLAEDDVSEIMVNAPDRVFVERGGRLELTDTAFSSDAAVRRVIDRIVAPLGRRIDESTPLVDARLQDGSRVNAIIPPLALNGATLTIRKFRRQRILPEELVKWGCIDDEGLVILRQMVRDRKNIMISGGTGSGKTTLLNILSGFIPENERIITIEDAAELQLPQPHVVRLESRPPNLEGKGAISIRDLLKNTLRMRPDRIVIGECRGGEALDMLQAMNTGHDGSLSTVHANTPVDALRRIETLVLFAGTDLPHRAIREQVAGAIHLVVQQSRMKDGRRRVTAIAAMEGLADNGYHLNFLWTPKDVPAFETTEAGLVGGHA